ncbi:antitoxin HicB [Streptococcus penaeicida]|uniref:Antitoxin HicB n=1 Tax=Streptococcus penaeicida TaxID=1765960 RepID=A0A2N8LC68_9STRE|nr:type II toxin-antitoxin system HicB family antitoxin [Streptococcus penaeicida]PND47750.1 antitoxin HicB [Streptococcus penaeicida]
MLEKILYPCIITEEDNVFYVNFPDIKACFTDGDTLEEAIYNAKDVLTGVLIDMIANNEEFPKPIFPKYEENEKVVFIDVLKSYIYSKADNRSIKKTLTIPKWLNDLGTEQDINFSQLLQEALKEKLNA